MRITELFPDLIRVIHEAHAKVGLVTHHDIHHAVRVGNMAMDIARHTWPRDKQAQIHAGIAGLCHNADRIIAHWTAEPSEDHIRELVSSWLSNVDIDAEHLKQIVTAVIRHDRRNDPSDSHVQIALMDADRIVNLALDLVMRNGQFFSTIPTIDYEHFTSDPAATYHDPRSVLRNVVEMLDWVNFGGPFCIRTTYGLDLGRQRAARIVQYIDDLKQQLQEEGIYPSPFLHLVKQ